MHELTLSFEFLEVIYPSEEVKVILSFDLLDLLKLLKFVKVFLDRIFNLDQIIIRLKLDIRLQNSLIDFLHFRHFDNYNKIPPPSIKGKWRTIIAYKVFED